MSEGTPLIFVDTNIFLDLYRIRNSDISLKYLHLLEKHKDKLIISSQVEMEYKKNRQKTILKSLKSYSSPDRDKLTPPALVANIQAAKIINKKKKEISTQQKKISEKIVKILKNPSVNDEVFKILQRIFKHKSPYNLDRKNKKLLQIQRFAKKRFIIGCPPRKRDDTTIGDAVNWEWIIDCSKESGKDIIIVSRDEDYGLFYNNQSYLNDWLSLEFKERVSRKRKLTLTKKLSEALKAVNAPVTDKMIEAEKSVDYSKKITQLSFNWAVGRHYKGN
jgi:predicted nucleic acid-binding protein